MVSILNRFTISIELRSAGRSDYLMIDYRLSGAKSVPKRTKGEPKGSQMGAKRMPREPTGRQEDAKGAKGPKGCKKKEGMLQTLAASSKYEPVIGTSEPSFRGEKVS